MWPKNWLQRRHGSRNRELALLREQNDLLRLLLQQQGVTGLPLKPKPQSPVRQRDESDIVVMTRTKHFEQQEQDRAKARRSQFVDRLDDVAPTPSPTPPTGGTKH